MRVGDDIFASSFKDHPPMEVLPVTTIIARVLVVKSRLCLRSLRTARGRQRLLVES